MSEVLEVGNKTLLKEVHIKGWRYKSKLGSLADETYGKEIREIEKALIKLGLSRNEARVYVFLARSGVKKASEVSSVLSLNRTETYKVLTKLQRIGLVSAVLERPLKFVALPLEDSLNLLIESKKLSVKVLEEEREKLINIWRNLPKIDVSPIKRYFFQILEGYKSIALKFKDIIEGSIERLCVTLTAENHVYKFYHTGLLDSMEKAIRRGVKVMLIVADSPRVAFFIKDLRKCHTKYIKCRINEISSFITSDDERLLLFLEPGLNIEKEANKPVVFYTNCTVLVKTFNRLFWSLWEETYLEN